MALNVGHAAGCRGWPGRRARTPRPRRCVPASRVPSGRRPHQRPAQQVGRHLHRGTGEERPRQPPPAQRAAAFGRPLRRNRCELRRRPRVDHVVLREPSALSRAPRRTASRRGAHGDASRCRPRTSRRAAAPTGCARRLQVEPVGDRQLISSAVPVRAAASNTASRSRSTGSRRPILRAVRWPMMLTDGFSIARITRAVISSSRLVEVRVHRRHGDVEARQELLVPVHRAVGVDVELGAVEQAHLRVAGLELGDLHALGQDLLVGHPLHREVGRVVGDGVVGVPVFGGGLDHCSRVASPSVRFVWVCRSPRICCR